MPYGPRPIEEVRAFAFEITAYLVQRGIKLLVVACNTASALALDDLSLEFFDVPVIGVVKPGADAACGHLRQRAPDRVHGASGVV